MPEAQTAPETLPQGAAPVSDSSGSAAEPADSPDDIKIGDKVFKSQGEAFAYAQQELGKKEREIEIADAYRAGVADAAGQPQYAQPLLQQPQTPPDDPEWEQKFYSDPKKTLKEYGERIREEVKQEMRHEYRTVTEEDRLWSQFYGRHPDLVGFEEDARLTVDKFKDDLAAITRAKGKEAGFDFLAQKTRAKFQAYAAAQKPQRELSNGKAGPSPGTQTSVTLQQKKEAPLDFISQVRNLRKSRA